jgi:hypothetical protein
VRWRRGSRVVVVLAAMALVVLPWAVRLRVDPQPAGLVARTSAFNLYVGNVGARPPYKELGATEAERTAVATARVKQVVWADMPAWPWHKVQRTLPRFVGAAHAAGGGPGGAAPRTRSTCERAAGCSTTRRRVGGCRGCAS